MTGAIEALYIYDRYNAPIVQQTYKGRPPSSKVVLQAYLAQPTPRPALLDLQHLSPPTLLFSYRHADLLLLSPSSAEIEPLAVIEFLHRVVEILEDFLGPPLIASQIESAYDVVAQLLSEICDAGLIASTEPNALREVVEVPGFVSRILGTNALSGNSANMPVFVPQPTAAIPWRRANVRHTNNEFYVDVVESMTAIIAPSGRPLSARANGSIACTSKITGVPDMTVRLDFPGGASSAAGSVELPVFHPCVRLKTWREQPGTLSFVPPDGRFVLAGYEVDLLPFTSGKSASINSNFRLPVTLQLRKSLGTAGNEFELRVNYQSTYSGALAAKAAPSRAAFTGSSQKPSLETLVVSVPLPGVTRSPSDIRVSKGMVEYVPETKSIEWKVLASRSTKPGQSLDPSGVAVLKVSLPATLGAGSAPVADFEDDTYQTRASTPPPSEETLENQKKKNAAFMPSVAVASFQIKGWLPSGIKVGAVEFDPRRTKGLGDIKPYKGVRYLCVSDKGIETRC